MICVVGSMEIITQNNLELILQCLSHTEFRVLKSSVMIRSLLLSLSKTSSRIYSNLTFLEETKIFSINTFLPSKWIFSWPFRGYKIVSKYVLYVISKEYTNSISKSFLVKDCVPFCFPAFEISNIITFFAVCFLQEYTTITVV